MSESDLFEYDTPQITGGDTDSASEDGSCCILNSKQTKTIEDLQQKARKRSEDEALQRRTGIILSLRACSIQSDIILLVVKDLLGG